MYVHIGKDNIIKYDKIISILNIKNNLKEILKNFDFEEKCDINNISDKYKSVIIVEENNINKIYFSNISSITLAKRIQKNII